MPSPHRPQPPTRSLLFAGLAVAFTVLLAPTAGATTTVTRVGNAITMTGAAAGDDVTSGSIVGYVGFSATSGVLRVGPGCRLLPAERGRRTADCGDLARRGNPLTLRATLGAGDDRLTLAWGSDRQPRLIADGGEGNDHIYGTWLADEIHGGPGDDWLMGGLDRDDLHGDAGNDAVFGGADSDAVFGGAGRDRLFGDLEPGSLDTQGGSARGVSIGDGAGMDLIDATDSPSAAELARMTPEQILAVAPEADTVDCGRGARDLATVDRPDLGSTVECEAISGPDHVTPLPAMTPQFPATLAIAARPSASLMGARRGAPVRFVSTSSAGGYISAKLELSRSDARRLRVPRLIGGLSSIVTEPRVATELFLRLNWSVRDALGRADRLSAKLTVVALHDDAAGTGRETTTATRTVVLQ